MAKSRHSAGSMQQHVVGVRGIVGEDTLVLGQAATSLLPQARDQYCAVVDVTPINYLLLSPDEQEAVITGFLSLLNGVGFACQILVRTTPLDVRPYLESFRHQVDTAQRTPSDQATALAALAANHITFVKQLATRRRLLARRFYIVIPAQTADEQALHTLTWTRLRHGLALLRRRSKQEQVVAAARARSIARSQLDLRVNQIITLLGKAGLTASRVRGTALAQLYHSCLLPQRAYQAPLANELLAGIQRPTQARAPRRWARHRQARHPVSPTTPSSQTSAPVPDPPPMAGHHHRSPYHDPTVAEETAPFLGLRDLLAPGWGEITPHAVELDGEWSRTLVVVGYPRHVYPGWIPSIISSDIPHDLAMHLIPIEAGPMIRRLTRQMAEYRSSELLDARQGRMADAERTVAYQDVERLRDRLQRGEERIFAVSLYLTVHAPSPRALDEYTAQLRTALDNLLLLAHEAVYEHDLGLRSCLPEAQDYLKRSRLLDGSSVATFFPFASSTLSMDQGILYGTASDGGLIILDPFSAELENANQVVFAKSGAGKSYACKLQALRMLMLGYSVLVIDPESEWRRLCLAQHGETVRIAPGSTTHINPFDLPLLGAPPERERRDGLAEHILTLLSLLDLMLADHTAGRTATLSQREKSYLEKAISATYRQAGITSDPRTHTHPAPLLADLYQTITSGGVGKDTFHLAERLHRYVAGSMSELFAGPTNVALENPLVVFDVRDMDAELRPIGLFLIANLVWTRTRREQSRQPRLLYIDEAWTLMQYPEGGRFLSDIARRARKYYLGLCTITQDVEDFLGNEHGRTVLSNASIKLLMKQDSTTVGPVTEAFHLSQGERSFILGCNKGEGLLFARSAHVALFVERSDQEHALVTSDPRELAQQPERPIAERRGPPGAWPLVPDEAARWSGKSAHLATEEAQP